MSTPRKKRAANKPVPITATERAPALAGPDVLTEVRGLILTARGQVAQAVNAGLTMLYWQIGSRIHQDILKQERAEYGKEIVSALGRQLSAEFGRGFDEKSLRHMLKFAEAFPDESIVSALRRQLAWTHFKQIIYIDDPLKRDFYAEMCRVERWSTRTLRQKIDVETLDPNEVPGWDAEDCIASRAFGDRWLAQARTCVLLVPSVIVPTERNVAINPAHADLADIVASDPRPVAWDRRLGALEGA